MKYQLYMNDSKKYQWLLVVISDWFVWNWIDFFTIGVEMLLLEFVWMLCSDVRVILKNVLFVDVTDKSNISNDHHK